MPRAPKPNELQRRRDPRGHTNDPYAVRSVPQIRDELERRGIKLSRTRVQQLLESGLRKIREQVSHLSREF